MEETMLEKLKDCGVDVDTALERFMQKKELYIRFLKKFNEDKNFDGLKESIENRSFHDAFHYGHTLKGVAGNLGLTPIFEQVAELVDVLRNSEKKTYSEDEISKMNEMFCDLEKIYNQLYSIIAEQ